MTNKPMLSVDLRVLGKAPLGERYYLCECPKCGWVGSSEECTQDEVLCLQKAGDDRCYGEADEIDAARLLGLMQSGAFEKPAAHPLEPARWERMSVMRGGQWWPCADKAEADAAVLCGWKVRPLYTEHQAPAVVLPERAAQHQGDPVACLIRSRNIITQANIAVDGKDHFSTWSEWEPSSIEYGRAVTDSRRNEPVCYEMELLFKEQPAPVADGTTSDKYRAELYDEVWQKARDMGFANVSDALAEVARLNGVKL